jgi:hypothetical protein
VTEAGFYYLSRMFHGSEHGRAIGLDTPSIDRGQSTTFSAHVALFENNVPAFENVARPGGVARARVHRDRAAGQDRRGQRGTFADRGFGASAFVRAVLSKTLAERGRALGHRFHRALDLPGATARAST